MNANEFNERNRHFIQSMKDDANLRKASQAWYLQASRQEYSYHFSWLGLPIIQFPQDVVAMQEIVWRTRPDVIVETGVARGGSLLLYASLLELIGGEGLVVGIDVDIRAPNRAAIEGHALSKRIRLIQGSSVDSAIVEQVAAIAKKGRRVLVVLDSNHTHFHVARELECYAPLVTCESYLVVFDTVIEDMPPEFVKDRPWAPGNSPKTAVNEFLTRTDRFRIDDEIDAKLSISAAPGGYLRCVKD
jgi:cephalosporin hydroxylase